MVNHLKLDIKISKLNIRSEMKKNHSVDAFCLNALKFDYATIEKSFSGFRDSLQIQLPFSIHM